MNIGATVAAANTGEGGNGVSVAITVTEKKKEINVEQKIYFFTVIFQHSCM